MVEWGGEIEYTFGEQPPLVSRYFSNRKDTSFSPFSSQISTNKTNIILLIFYTRL